MLKVELRVEYAGCEWFGFFAHFLEIGLSAGGGEILSIRFTFGAFDV
jgi:hypothetical protein